jgi:hypothetical protein
VPGSERKGGGAVKPGVCRLRRLGVLRVVFRPILARLGRL